MKSRRAGEKERTRDRTNVKFCGCGGHVLLETTAFLLLADALKRQGGETEAAKSAKVLTAQRALFPVS